MAVNAHTLYMPLDEEEVAFFSPRERLQRGGGWLAAFLVLMMLVVVAWTVQAADWSEGLGLVQTAVTAGALMGLLLALTNWGSLFTTLYSLLACVATVVSLLVGGFLRAPSLHAGLLELAQRNATWASNLWHRQPSADNLIFVLQLLLLGWWMGHFAMWMVFRHQQVWLAALPAGVGLMFNAYYSPKHLTTYLLFFLLIVLMLAIRVELARNEARWQLAHIRYSPDIYLDFLRDGFVFAIAVVAITYFVPTGGGERRWTELFRPFDSQWHEVQDTWNRAFTSLKYPGTVQVTTFGKSLTLGGPVSLTDRPIFQGQTPERVYWRAAAFDTYNGQQWLNTDTKVISVDRNKPLPEPDYSLTKEITVTVQTLEVGQDVLFSAPQPARSSLPVNVDYSPQPGDQNTTGGSPAALAVSLMRSRVGLARDSVYQVTSRPSVAPPDLLRADNQPYPDAIKAHYLQLPDELPQRVRDLAQQITAPYNTAYDKAAAVEAYVRSFPYNNQIAAPPAGRDGVDYFLFDIKQGYCDYYASAMAMMLRVVGVPARFVVGYTPGEETTQPGTWLVREENAHAWVEVFFPQYGWVQFEPTASQPLLDRPAPLPPQAQPTPQPTSDANQALNRPNRDQKDTDPGVAGQSSGSSLVRRNPVLRFIVDHRIALGAGAGLVLALAATTILLRRRQRNLLLPDRGLVARLFDLLPYWAERLHVPWPASHTPLEHAQALGMAVPDAAPPANHLARLYVAQRYGRQELAPETLHAAAGDWRTIQPLLWRSWLRRMLPVRGGPHAAFRRKQKPAE